MMYGQMTAGSWIYIGTQGILQGTYETLSALAKRHFGGDLSGRFVLTGGMGGMGGAQPLAATMNGAAILCVEVDRSRIEKRLKTGYCDKIVTELDEALRLVLEAKGKKQALSVGLVGNCSDTHPEIVRRGIIPDVVTDQTSAHDELNGYVPGGMNAFDFPGFVPAYIRPLFCEGKGPFRWAALSGDPEDIRKTDEIVLKLFPEDKALVRWIELAEKKVKSQGLPARICWLGYGDRAKFGRAINDAVARGEISAPIVIGRDHLDCGSVASPYRETEGMKDGSDAIADWPLLNALLNTASGASWVSIHHGGGVGMGLSIHAGQVIVADGTKEMEKRLGRVLTNDPGIGVARHADAGYEEAIEVAKKKAIKIPMLE